MKKIIMVVSISLLLCSCAIQKDLVATGGSKSDGIVRMSFTYDKRIEIPQLNMNQGLHAATQRCKAWGYTGAEPFDGHTATCIDQRPLGCVTEMITVEYQCTGK